MDAKRIALTLGVGLFCGLLGPAEAQAAPQLPEPIEVEEFDAPLVFVPVFGDPDAAFDAPLVFLDIYAGYAVVETGGDDEVSFDEPILFVPLHGSPEALGDKDKPGTGSVLLSIPLQLELSKQQIEESEESEDDVAFDVPLAGYDVPLFGFDVPLAGAVLYEGLAEEVFGTSLVVIPLVSDPEAVGWCEDECYEASYLLPLEQGGDIDAPPLMLPVL